MVGPILYIFISVGFFVTVGLGTVFYTYYMMRRRPT